MRFLNRSKAGFGLLALGLFLAQCFFIAPSARASQVLDIKSFGAKCDGSNDAGAVQAAINAMNSGDILNISCMASIGSSGVYIDGKTNLTVQGQPGGGFKAIAIPGSSQQLDFGPAVFVVKYSSGIVVKDFEINSNGLPATAMLMFQNSGSRVENMKLHDVGWSTSVVGGALGALYNTNNIYNGNLVYNTGTPTPTENGIRGMWIRDTNPLITNNEVHHAGGSAIVCDCTVAEIAYNNSHDNQVSGYKVQGGHLTTGLIKFHDNKSVGTYQDLTIDSIDSRLEIYNNEFSFSRGDGVYSNGAFGADLYIANNYFHDEKGSAIKVFTAAKVVIQNNRLHRNGNSIEFQPRTSGNPGTVSITNNDIRTATWNGIVIANYEYGSGTMGTVAVTGNSITGAGSGGWYMENDIGGSVSQSGNCWSGNSNYNISDGRGILTSPASSIACPDPTASTDTTAPTVSITSPVGGSMVSGTVTVSANAADNVGVTGVQFKMDGSNLGAEDTAAPYSASWNTSSVTNGSHTISAVARDLAGNTQTAVVTVNVSNISTSDVTPPVISSVAVTGITSQGATITWITDEPADTQVDYGASASYVSSTPVNTALSTSHSAVLSALSPSTAYQFQVKSRDAAGNLALSGNQTFTTASGTSSLPQGPWSAGYYKLGKKNSFGGLITSRTDQAIDFNWSGSPAPGVTSDSFAVRWQAMLNFPSTGTYTFSATTDDGMRIWIDGVQVLNKWFDQGVTTYTFAKSLNAGSHSVKVEYYDKSSSATARLSWVLSSVAGANIINPESMEYVEQYLLNMRHGR